MKSFFTYNNLIIEFITSGFGRNKIICFHGFGRKAEDFLIFNELLTNDQQLVSINLFAHEGSSFPASRIDNLPITKEEWKEVFIAFLEHISADNVDLLGYSMGGRVALVTLEIIPEKIKSLLLIAPDGLKINPLYKFASGTKIGRSLYRGIVDNPAWLFRIAKWLNKLGMLNDKLHRFVHVHLDTKEKRQQVHDAWLIYKFLFPNLDKLAVLIRNNNGFSFHMIFGEMDSVITPRIGEKFCDKIGNRKCFYMIPSGHRLLNDRTIQFIRDKKLWPLT